MDRLSDPSIYHISTLKLKHAASIVVLYGVYMYSY